MAVDITAYTGREQAYVKHFFLENYLERLVHKTASKFTEIAYVDGFSGPWQSGSETYDDTSFGIALGALRRAKGSWKAHGRDVHMSAHLVEKSGQAYELLKAVPSRYPDIKIKTYNADFVTAAPSILSDIPSTAFAFLFIDPKGWRIDTSALSTLLKRPNTEIVFNFMFDFINRAASITDPVVISGLNQLMPHGEWKAKIEAVPPVASGGSNAIARKQILVNAFSETLARIGGFSFVAETPVLRPLADRTLYSLVYATRKAAGIEVFRDCQIKTLTEQSAVRSAAKIINAQSASGQAELFSQSQMAGDDVAEELANERIEAEKVLLELVPQEPESIPYGDVWPRVLTKRVVRKVDVNAIAGRLRKSGELVFPNWPSGKRVPDDNFKLSRPAAH